MQQFQFPKDCKVGSGVKIVADDIVLGNNVTLGDNVVLAGDMIDIGNNVVIGSNSDIRSANIQIEEGCEIGARSKILVADRFHIGIASRISADASITCRQFTAKKFLYLAQGFFVGYGGTYESTSVVELGENVALGPHNILNANHKISLADNVGSGSYVTIWTHGYHFGHSVLDGYPLAHKGVVIDENVWLGYHVTVLPAVEIGKNTIVAACSVVSRSLPADCLAAGSPAQFKKELKPNPMSERDTHQYLLNLLDRWTQELLWKGLDAKMMESHVVRISRPQSNTIVQVVDGSSALTPVLRNDHAIYILAGGSFDVTNVEHEMVTFFDVRKKQIHGNRNELVEDLRDFLRRNTLSCANDRVFTSIEPQPFSRLKRMA